MKKVLAIILTLSLLIAVCPLGLFTFTANAATSGYYTYTVSNGEATITGCDTSVSGDITIPSTLGGYPVTSIGYNAFYKCSSLTSITIPNSVTSIGDYAFEGCESLTSITIPDSVTSIGSEVLSECWSFTKLIIADGSKTVTATMSSIVWLDYLKEVVIPDSVTSIGERAFYNCSNLTSVTIGNGVTSIGAGAFERTGLGSITIPDSVKRIGDRAFYGCGNLANITISDSVTSIGSYAFSSTKYADDILLNSNGIIYVGNHLYEVVYLSDEQIRDGTKCIADSAFSGCTELTSITIPDSVTSIGYNAFEGCQGLVDVWYQGSESEKADINIDSSNSYLTNATWHYNTCEKDHAYSGACDDSCNNCEWIRTGTSNHIYDNEYDPACNLCGYTRTVPNHPYLTYTVSYGEATITDCDTSIRGDITIPSTLGGYPVTSIGSYAFSYCDELTSITIPDSVTTIGNSAFYSCYGLTSVNITDLEAWCNIEFGSYDANPLYYANDLYLNGNFVTNLVIPEGITEIKNSAFSGCTSLTSITIPDGVTSIGEYAFYNCSSLTSIAIPDGVTSIGIRAFLNCTGLTSINIPNSVTSIGERTFYQCTGLTSITIPDSVTSIGEDAFVRCSSLTSITIPDRVTYIGSCAFLNCSSLTSITIPNGVTSIGKATFEGCSSLTAITIPNGVTSIGNYAFKGCRSLTSITIPNSVTSIGNEAFEGCQRLVDVWYQGSEIEKADINIGSSNSYLTNATWHYNTCENNHAYSSDCDDSCNNCEWIRTGTSNHIYDNEYDPACNLCGYTRTVPNHPYLTYTVSNGEATITGCDTSVSGDIIIPSSLGGYPVTSIGYLAFRDCISLTSITIADSVKSIGNLAFYNCGSLTSVTIPNGVTSIGNYAFHSCSGLTSITIPDSVMSIGDAAFYDCESLTSVTIPNGVTSIGNYAFHSCSGLTSITIPDSVMSIGDAAFYDCESLTSITIPDGVTSIGYDAFLCCTSLTSITIPNSVTSIGDKALYNCSSLTSVTIPNSVTSIGIGAFSGCASLTFVTIPDSVTSIGERAFYNCSSLTSIIIPNSVTSIGEYAFSGCTGLKNIIVDSNNQFYSSVDGVLFNKDKTELICYPMGKTNVSYIIPDSVTSIGERAFYNCSSLTSITIPDSVTSIGDGAFSYCGSLTSITIPDSVTSIGVRVFCNCTSLTSFIIPDGVTSIGDGAFSYCGSLTSITIPDGVTSIGYDAFLGCVVLENIIVYSNNQFYSSVDGVLFNKDKTELICYPMGKTNLSYTIPDSVMSIGNSAFWDCTSLTSITIPDGVTSIGDKAFFGCISLTSITIPNSVTSIGYATFYHCRSLATITFPDGVTSIGDSAFRECISLTSITVPDSITSIGHNAFEGCLGLVDVWYQGSEIEKADINIASSNSYLTNATWHYNTCENDHAYSSDCDDSCNNCEWIRTGASNHIYDNEYDPACNLCGYTRTVPNHPYLTYTVSNGEVTITGCDTSVSGDIIIPSSLGGCPVTSIGDYAFHSCSSLTSITIPNSVTSIGNSAFYYCSSLTSITIPNSVTSIGNGVFSGCTGLENITVDSNNQFYSSVDGVLFNKDKTELICYPMAKTNLSYAIPDSVTSIGDCAFEGCANLTLLIDKNNIYAINYAKANGINYKTGLYTVTFKDENGKVLSEKQYYSGDEIEIPETPSKPADNTYTYTFAGWDSEVVACDGNKVYTALFTPIHIDYTVTFENYDGTVISTNTYHYGDSVTVPETPSKPADNTYTYTFAGWDSEVVACDGDKVYTALFTPIYIDYTVTFENYDGTVISTNTYHYGDSVTVPETPNKPADNTYTYTFAGWDSEVVACDGNKVYTALFTPIYIDYTVTFKNYDGSVISSKEYHFNDIIEVPTNPTRESDAAYTYIFSGWDKTVLGVCVGNAEYTAQYTSSYIYYTIEFKDWDGSTISKSSIYRYGDEIVVPETPSKPADNTYTYTFAGWDSEVVACDGNKVYTALFTPIYIDYTVTFENYDGTVISTNTYHYGDSVTVPETPSKPADNTYTYTFAGWDSEVVACDGDKVYTALFTPIYIDYTVTFENYDGTVISTNTYHYGDSVTVPETPTRESIDGKGYVFEGWESEVVDCEGNKTYKAVYREFSFGDSNGDGKVNGSDVITLCQYLANYDYDTETSTIKIDQGADANNDGEFNGSDVIILCQYLANYDYDTGSSTIVLGPQK